MDWTQWSVEVAWRHSQVQPIIQQDAEDPHRSQQAKLLQFPRLLRREGRSFHSMQSVSRLKVSSCSTLFPRFMINLVLLLYWCFYFACRQLHAHTLKKNIFIICIIFVISHIIPYLIPSHFLTNLPVARWFSQTAQVSLWDARRPCQTSTTKSTSSMSTGSAYHDVNTITKLIFTFDLGNDMFDP